MAAKSIKRIASWMAITTISLSLLACLLIIVRRSTALLEVTVTAIEADQEPRDHGIPLLKRQEALPDYELQLVLQRGWGKVKLGTHVNSSAVDGLVWKLSDPVSLSDVSTLRLLDQDKVVSDTLAEVAVRGKTVTEGNYRFEFVTQRSLEAGIQSFTGTTLGQSIVLAFAIAVALLIGTLFF